MSKLSDTQLLVLSSAAQREDHVAVLPRNLKGGAAAKVVTPLLAKGLLNEVLAKPGTPIWRRDETEGRAYALVITDAGGNAINVELDPAGGAESAAKPDKSTAKSPASSGRKRSGESQAGRPREGSKLAKVIDLLRAPGGATLDRLVKATGWLPHTTRAALTGLRKRGYALDRKREDGKTRYRITALPRPGAKPAASPARPPDEMRRADALLEAAIRAASRRKYERWSIGWRLISAGLHPQKIVNEMIVELIAALERESLPRSEIDELLVAAGLAILAHRDLTWARAHGAVLSKLLARKAPDAATRTEGRPAHKEEHRSPRYPRSPRARRARPEPAPD